MATRTKVSTEALGLIDEGRVKAMFDMAVETAVKDIDDRGTDGAARTVVLKVHLKPMVAEGLVQDVDVDFEVEAKVPAKRSRVYRMEIQGGKALLFNPVDRDQPRQRTIDEATKD